MKLFILMVIYFLIALTREHILPEKIEPEYLTRA